MPPPAHAEVQRLLAQVTSITGESYDPSRYAGRWTANPVLLSATTVVYLGTTPAARDRISVERARLDWARRAGVPVPEMIDRAPDDSWLLVRRVPDDDVYGPGYVDAAVEVATIIGRAAEPPPAVPARSRRASRHDLLLRTARGVASPLRLAEFRRVQREAAALPAEQLTHGDFHLANLLSDGGRRITVIDFEFVGPGPAALDLTSLWADLRDQADRDRLLEATFRLHPGRREHVLLLLHWHALRHLADLVTAAPIRTRRPNQLARAAAAVAEARSLRARG